jgi:hypothetical protein
VTDIGVCVLMGEGYYYLGDGGAAPWMPEAIRLSTCPVFQCSNLARVLVLLSISHAGSFELLKKG